MLPNNEEEENEDPDSRVFYSLSKQQIHTIRLPEIRGKRCCGSSQNGWMRILDEESDIFLLHPCLKNELTCLTNPTLIIKTMNRNFAPWKRSVTSTYGLYRLAFWRIGHSAYNDIDIVHRCTDGGCGLSQGLLLLPGCCSSHLPSPH